MKGDHAWTQFCHLRLCWDTYQQIYFQMTSFEQLKAAFLVFAAKRGCSLFKKKNDAFNVYHNILCLEKELFLTLS
mgnify:CR=1 FL=1